MEPEDEEAPSPPPAPEPVFRPAAAVAIAAPPPEPVRPPAPGGEHGTRPAGPELFGSPRPGSKEPAFRIIELRVAPDGRVNARLRRELVAKVYRKPTAIRLVRYDAAAMPKDEAVLVLLRPSGSCIGVYASGTGRKAPSRVASRARRMVRDLMPELFPRRRPRGERRTSRRATAVRPRKRRTSRQPVKKGRKGR